MDQKITVRFNRAIATRPRDPREQMDYLIGLGLFQSRHRDAAA